MLVIRPTVDHPTTNDYFINGGALYYHWQKVALGEGQFFVNPARYGYTGGIEPSATHPPFYATYLGAFSVVGLDGVTEHRLESCLLGTLTIALVGLLGRKLGGDRVGLLRPRFDAFYRISGSTTACCSRRQPRSSRLR